MHIRLAESEDAHNACDVLRRSITELCELDHHGDKAFLARWLANKTPENVRRWILSSHVFIAEEDGRTLGVCALSFRGQIMLNYVAPEARFTGVSKALLAEMESKAQSIGLP